MSRKLLLCCCVLLSTHLAWSQTSPSERSDEQPKVGRLGKPEALVFTGLKTYSADQLRQVITNDFDVVLAGNANAPLKEYLGVLERRLSEGFRKSGFPHAKISVDADSAKQSIQIAIAEGELFHNGDVKVDGSSKVDPKVLSKFLTEADAHLSPEEVAIKRTNLRDEDEDSDRSLWKPGQAADFFHPPAKTYEESIKLGLAAQGYFFPQFDAEVKPANNARAELWIHIKDTGPKATIGHVIVEGIKHHDSEEIIEYLGIKPGLPVDNQQTAAWEQKLRKLNCFLESKVIVHPAIAPDAPSDLLVRVIEQPEGPFLEEQQTKQDEVLGKTARWMKDWNHGQQGDAVIAFQTEPKEVGRVRVIIVISPKHGFALDVECTPAGHPKPLRYTLIGAENTARLVSWHHQKELLATGDSHRFLGSITITIRYREDEDNPGNWSLSLGHNLGLQSNSDKNPFAFSVELSPASAIAFARSPKSNVKNKAGLLQVFYKDDVINLDAESGRIVSIHPPNSKTPLDKIKAVAVPELQTGEGFLYFQSGAFQRYVNHLNTQTAEFQKANNPQRPLSSTLEFFFGEAERIGQLNQTDVPIALLGKLIQLDALRPLDRLWIEHQAQTKEKAKFVLPTSSETDLKLFGLEKKIPFGMGKPLARMAFAGHRLIAPAESGAARVGWNMALLCDGRFAEVQTNLRRLAQSPEIGPLTCWYAGFVFGMLHKPWGEAFAQAGLKKLQPEQFRREADQLLPAESLLFELVESLGNAVRQLDADEFGQLVMLLGDQSNHPALPQLVKQLREEQGTPSRKFLLESLVTLWNIRGQTYCRGHLEKLAGKSAIQQTSHFTGGLEKSRSDDSQGKAGDDLDQTVRDILKNPSVRPSEKD